jgi:hypothetical protein
MARDKLITVRIEGEKREAFNEWAKSRKLDTSALLYEFIEACLLGRIDEKLLKPSQLDTEQLDRIVAERIDATIDEKIESALADLRSRLAAVEAREREVASDRGKLIA